jgi:hypothetical protein
VVFLVHFSLQRRRRRRRLSGAVSLGWGTEGGREGGEEGRKGRLAVSLVCSFIQDQGIRGHLCEEGREGVCVKS